ncbi:hypothetical protein CDAR_375241 [Caerostris darwini]|uniref:Uncharacterized protein n=1 Tax=Caerostris darwini TaxID=1538125 RepID=A0AAV4R9X7_9ARAC|nr:hypothetical protein CDAR_375241 [Caerostris darwini]
MVRLWGKVLGHVLFSVCLCTRERMLLCRTSKYAEFHPKLFSKRLLRRDSWDRELIGLGMVWAVVTVMIAGHYCSVLSLLLRTVEFIFCLDFFVWIYI